LKLLTILSSLSLDLCKRIIASKLRGDTEDTISEEKEVSKSAVTKLWRLYRETGGYISTGSITMLPVPTRAAGSPLYRRVNLSKLDKLSLNNPTRLLS
jgi:hypothetical protein